VTCERPFSSGVLIGYCSLSRLMIGWFQMLPVPSGIRWYSGFHLIVISIMWFLLLVLWLCWRFNDVVIKVTWSSRPGIAISSRVSWLNDHFWLAVIFFWLVLTVSDLRIFQQVCFLFSNKLLQANLPVTSILQLQTTYF